MTMWTLERLILSLLLCALSGQLALAQACRLQVAPAGLPEGAILLRNSAKSVGVYTAEVRRDDDGSLNAYHPCGANYRDDECVSDYGLDHICSGVTMHDSDNRRIPPSERDPTTGRWSSIRCLRAFREARANDYPLCGQGKTCVYKWPGVVLQARPPPVAGLSPKIPAIQTDGPYKGYYISSTTLGRSDRTVPGGKAYIDARRVPFIVVPGGSVLIRDWGFGSSTRADIALVLAKRRNGRVRAVFAVVADVGPTDEIGEGSPALLGRLHELSQEELGGERPRPAAIPGANIPGKATYALFKGSGHYLEGIWPARDLTAADIASAGQRALADVGGIEALAGCAGIPGDTSSISFATK